MPPSSPNEALNSGADRAEKPQGGAWLHPHLADWGVGESWLIKQWTQAEGTAGGGPSRGQTNATPDFRLETVESLEKPGTHTITIKKLQILCGNLAGIDPREKAGYLTRTQSQT